MCLDLLQPVLNVIKSSLFCAIIDKDNAHSALVVGLCDCTETFLTSRVPQGQHTLLTVDRDRLDATPKSNGHLLGRIERLITVALDDAGFSGRCLTDQHDFECFGRHVVEDFRGLECIYTAGESRHETP